MSCNFFNRIPPCCDNSNIFKIETDFRPKPNKNEEFAKIVQLIDSGIEENILLGIEFAQSVLSMDCFDLCQNLKKVFLSEGKQQLADDLFFFELLSNGWTVTEYTKETTLNNNICSYKQEETSVLFEKYNAKMSLEVLDNSIIFDWMNQDDETLKNEPYKWFLLNYYK